MKLLKIYTSILKYAGLEPDDQGYINTVMDDKREPTVIKGARLVLPTPEQLKSINPNEKIVFHPLTEDFIKGGESPVIKKLKNIINIRLNYTAGIVAQSLLNLIASPELHNKLTKEQSSILMHVKDADEKSVINFIHIMVNGVKTKPDRLFTHVYLNRGGYYREKKFCRTGIVSFPFYEELKLDKVEKIRVKDKQTYKELFQFIFPELDSEEEYNYGSNSRIAPFLDALMHASANIASRLNDIIEVYRDYIDEADSLTFDSDWLEYFTNLEDLSSEIRRVPVQHGNEGSLAVTEEEQEQPAIPVPVQQPLQPPWAPQPPVPYPQQPGMYPPQQMVQPPEVKSTKRGINFKSLVQANPALAYNPNPLTPALMQQHMQQQAAQQMAMANQAPSWAQPQAPQGYPPQQQGYPQAPMQQPMMQQPSAPPGSAWVMTPQGWMLQPIQQQYPQQPQQPSWAQPGWR